MKKKLGIVFILCIIMIISGCIDSTTIISVRKDGSGLITETVYFNESVKQMMEGMMSGFGDQEDKKESEDSQDDGDKYSEYKDKASNFGTGVKFVSAEEVTKEDGSAGMKIIYSFTDVTKLSVKAQPDSPMGAGNEEVEENDAEEKIHFNFIKGRTPKLIIIMPHSDEEGDADEDAVEETADNDMANSMADAGMGMMKPFLKGMRISVQVELLDGKIKKTNATHVTNYEGKDRITLIEMEFSELLKDEENMKKMSSMSKIKDPKVAMEIMKDIPGIKVETAEKIEISIK